MVSIFQLIIFIADCKPIGKIWCWRCIKARKVAPVFLQWLHSNTKATILKSSELVSPTPHLDLWRSRAQAIWDLSRANVARSTLRSPTECPEGRSWSSHFKLLAPSASVPGLLWYLTVGGRILSNHTTQHPIILHGKHLLARLIIWSENLRLLHADDILLTS